MVGRSISAAVASCGRQGPTRGADWTNKRSTLQRVLGWPPLQRCPFKMAAAPGIANFILDPREKAGSWLLGEALALHRQHTCCRPIRCPSKTDRCQFSCGVASAPPDCSVFSGVVAPGHPPFDRRGSAETHAPPTECVPAVGTYGYVGRSLAPAPCGSSGRIRRERRRVEWRDITPCQDGPTMRPLGLVNLPVGL